MTKKRGLTDNPDQLSLFDYIAIKEQEKSKDPAPGSHAQSVRIKALVSEALKKSPLSREQVAARMSALTGADISKFMLDAWSAESKEYHRFPLEFLSAFCSATGNLRLVEFVNETNGTYCLPGPDAVRAQIQRLDEQRKDIQAERRKWELLLREIS